MQGVSHEENTPQMTHLEAIGCLFILTVWVSILSRYLVNAIEVILLQCCYVLLLFFLWVDFQLVCLLDSFSNLSIQEFSWTKCKLQKEVKIDQNFQIWFSHLAYLDYRSSYASYDMLLCIFLCFYICFLRFCFLFWIFTTFWNPWIEWNLYTFCTIYIESLFRPFKTDCLTYYIAKWLLRVYFRFRLNTNNHIMQNCEK